MVFGDSLLNRPGSGLISLSERLVRAPHRRTEGIAALALPRVFEQNCEHWNARRGAGGSAEDRHGIGANVTTAIYAPPVACDIGA